MKGTEHFKQTIKEYLDGRAQTDELFAVSYAKENKNLDDCITFILNQVKARKEALKAYQEEEMRKIQQRHSKPKPTAKAAQSNQTELSLFDF